MYDQGWSIPHTAMAQFCIDAAIFPRPHSNAKRLEIKTFYYTK